MILVTTEGINGRELEMLGLVKGSTIQTVNAVRDIGAGLKNLVRYSRKAVSGYRISPEGLDRMLRELDGMKREGRERHPVFTARKDTILPGGTILQYLMEHLGMESVEVSDMDGLEGYALSVLFIAGNREHTGK